jgi:hypothetical protein
MEVVHACETYRKDQTLRGTAHAVFHLGPVVAIDINGLKDYGKPKK